ncbi:TPA: YdaU family protein [Photobacterium damselae]
MHYYKRHIGDYNNKAARLTMLQHGAYNLLIDACYDREAFPTLEEAYDWLWASSEEEREAIRFVLGKFFVLEGKVYTQKRIQKEVGLYQERSLTNKKIALERETKRKEKLTKRLKDRNGCNTGRDTPVHGLSPNQEPLTINHKPLNKDLGSSEINPKKNSYPDEFEWLWANKPERYGPNPKKDAFHSCNARIRNGATWRELTEGMMRYKKFMDAEDKLGTKFVMQMKTFFGTSEYYTELWEIDHAKSKSGINKPSSAADAKEAMRQARAGRDAANTANGCGVGPNVRDIPSGMGGEERGGSTIDLDRRDWEAAP